MNPTNSNLEELLGFPYIFVFSIEYEKIYIFIEYEVTQIKCHDSQNTTKNLY